MPTAPDIKRTVVFFDGQNLFHHARAAFGCKYPDYSPLALAHCVCKQKGFNLQEVRFYTGVPEEAEEPRWNRFWAAKLLAMNREGIVTFSRTLRYRKRTIRSSDGTEVTKRIGEEKGIDIRIALDIVRMTRQNVLDVALLFSQDQDFSEVADEVRALSREQNRWIKIASAFPVGRSASNHRGINKTDWIEIDRAMYDACRDRRDYRPKSGRKR